MKFRIALSVLALCAVSAVPAWAHPHHVHAPGAEHGLTAGFFHPLFGLDHLLAMFAVGLLAAQLGGRAIWALPMAFLSLMLAGGAAGMAGIGLPAMEIGIALSVVVLGAALLIGSKYPLAAATLVVGCFGIMHGHAHGTELPAMSSAALYSVGFLLATAALHLAGIAAGLLLVRGERSVTLLRASGAAISVVGIVLLMRAI
ncbi:HupE/UreJ family protein [Anatilimnocola floriformis]|uniref:HupE/UreJ family protein n=1 Tax=Anatilimnocola floriformis TaxID=2948575 RepID=UPI0020C35671|nr:HupE/UreJ family protein [Anatilimnocola floriformis]